MKNKISEIILVALIVFMIGGILVSVKGNDNQEITEIISDFEQTSEFDTSGFVTNNPFEEDNANIIGRTNGKIGDGISKIVNKSIDLFFELIKKVVS